MPKISDEKLIERAKAIHGDKYKYLGLEKREGERYQRFKLLCKEHGEFSQSVSNHFAGKGCKRCAGTSVNAGRKHTLETVAAVAAKYGFQYEYKSLDYTNSVQPKVTYICKEHGEITQNLHNHLQGKGCRTCFELSLRHTLESAIKLCREKWGDRYEYTSLDYDKQRAGGGFQATLTIVCKQHGEFKQSLNSHTSGNGCPKCGEEERIAKATLTDEEILNKLNSIDAYTAVKVERSKDYRGYRVVSVCEKHGEFVQSGGNRLKGQACPKCSGIISKMNIELAEWLQSLGLTVELEKNLSANPKDYRLKWDIAIKEKPIAIEMHGIYWHSTEYKAPSFHAKKHQAALSSGYRTIHVFDDEWLTKKDIVKRHILSMLGMSNDKKVSARSCIAKEISAAEARKFMEKTHIQGFGAGSVHFGLFSADECVAVATFSMKEKGRGAKLSKDNAELIRYATSVSVRGGLGKLLSFAKKTLNFKKVTTFSDIRFFNGDIYKKLGFRAAGLLAPDYFYCRSGKRVHKSSLQKSKIWAQSIKGLAEFDPGMTESQLAKLNGYEKVYDCGKIRWELTL